MTTKSFIGKGSIYIKEKGTTDAMTSFGNCSELVLEFSEDKKEQKDFEGAGGAVVNTVSRIDAVTASITALSVSAQNVALALRGLVNVVAGQAVTDEPHTAKLGGFLLLTEMPDKSQGVTVTGTGGTPTYVEGTDYELKNSGIVVLSGGSINDDDPLELSYTSLPAYDIEGLTSSGKEYELIFDGLNEADSEKPVVVQAHRIKINPAEALGFITDDFAELPISLDLLKDASITSAGESQFVKIKMAQ